ncbi:MAG TPA: PQQ-binding-like beta-propeller repeat protein [Pyrinomonadaceae bacterium]|jgi:outer membrane protein assembly factor BamB|nr:PQQ-binding-like beta-propeller repeat protein [Pyrinomonadaceae bacterium]
MNTQRNDKVSRARRVGKLSALVVAFATLFAQAAYAQDWTQWRGPARDGIVPAKNTPATWPESFKRVWRVEVGEGYSSPIVANGRAFVHSRRDPEELVTAINLADGKITWQQKYAAPFQKNQYAVKMAKGPNATPLFAGGRLFTLGSTGVVNAWDATTGRSLWRKDFSKIVDTSKLFCGTAASPLLSGGLVVIQVGSDVHGGQITALDPATGEARWEWRGAGPGYASPVVFNVAGKEQIVSMTNGSIVGLDAKTGGELWSAPFPDEWHENITTPVWTGTHLVVSGTRQGTHAYTLAQAAGKWKATEAWKNADVTMYMSSPVYGDGVLYGHSVKRKGQFVALDAKTGTVRWITDGREGEHASVLLTPRHLVYLTNGADLIVARRAGQTFEAEKRYDVADAETYAMPVLLGTDIYVRDATSLIRLAPGSGGNSGR